MPHKPRHAKKGRPQREFRRPEYTQRQDPGSSPTPATSTTISAVRPAAAAPASPTRPGQSTAPAVDFSNVKKELKRIAMIAGAMFAILIVLSFFLR